MAVKSKSLSVLMLAALCLLGMRGLAFVGSAATSGGDSEGGSLVSATGLVKFMALFYGFQSGFSYLFTERAVKVYWPKGFQSDGDQKIAVYMVKLCAQSMVAPLLMSVIMLATDTVCKEFMQMLALYWAFATLDILRMLSKVEEIGGDKNTMYPYIPFAVVISYLSYSTIASTSSATPAVSSSFISATAIVKFIAFFHALQFFSCWVFTEQGLKAYWPDGFKTEKAKKIADLMCKGFGQNNIPMLVLSVIMLKEGTVSKEFMLMSALYWAFGTFDVARMTTTCEAVGVPKKVLQPYIPVSAAISVLSYAAWKTM